MDTQNIFGYSIFSGTKKECYALLQEKLLGKALLTKTKTREPFIVFTPNPEQLMLAQRNTIFEKDLHKANLLLPDGVGLVWAGQLLNRNLTERISGRETLEFLIDIAAKQSLPVFLLGGREASSMYAKKLRSRYGKDHPEWRVSYNVGAKDIEHETVEEKKSLSAEILYTKPKLLCVAYGAPYQERWVVEHIELLRKAGVRVVMVVGGAFDVLGGRILPPPRWVTVVGVEWLWRLFCQPWRWRRQLVLPRFVLRVMGEKIRG